LRREIVLISKESSLTCKKNNFYLYFYFYFYINLSFISFLYFRISEFSVKIQEQLFNLSNYFISNIIIGQKEIESTEIENLNRNLISIQNLNIEKTR
jgi:hypothetical protein